MYDHSLFNYKEDRVNEKITTQVYAKMPQYEYPSFSIQPHAQIFPTLTHAACWVFKQFRTALQTCRGVFFSNSFFSDCFCCLLLLQQKGVFSTTLSQVSSPHFFYCVGNVTSTVMRRLLILLFAYSTKVVPSYDVM